MAEKLETKKKAEETQEEKGQLFNFTQDNFVVRAESLEEAQKIFKETLTESKESDNG